MQKQKAIDHINNTLLPKLRRSNDQRGTRSDHVDLLVSLIRQSMNENNISIDDIDYNSLGSEILKRRLQ